MRKFVQLTGFLDGKNIQLTVNHRDLQRKWKIGRKLTEDDWYGTCWAIAVSEVLRAMISLSLATLGITYGPFSLSPPTVLWYVGEISQLIAAILENLIAIYLVVGLIFRSGYMLRTWVWTRVSSMVLLVSPLVLSMVALSTASILTTLPMVVIFIPLFIMLEAGRFYGLFIVR